MLTLVFFAALAGWLHSKAMAVPHRETPIYPLVPFSRSGAPRLNTSRFLWVNAQRVYGSDDPRARLVCLPLCSLDSRASSISGLEAFAAVVSVGRAERPVLPKPFVEISKPSPRMV